MQHHGHTEHEALQVSACLQRLILNPPLPALTSSVFRPFPSFAFPLPPPSLGSLGLAV